MCSSTLLRRHRQPFMFFTASVTPVCMCIFITGIETTKSNSSTLGQTLSAWIARPSGNAHFDEAAPVHVDQRAIALVGDGRDAGRLEGLVDLDAHDRAFADGHLGPRLAKGVDRRGDDLGWVVMPDSPAATRPALGFSSTRFPRTRTG